MAFKIDISGSYFFPVEVEQPIDGGKFQKSSFDAKFKRLSRTEMRGIFDRIPSDKKVIDDPITDDEILNDMFLGWKGAITEDGSEFPYSETNREIMLEIAGVSGAIIAAWFKSLQGSKAKN